MTDPSLRLEGVSFAWESGRPVLDRVDLELGPGLTLLAGPNGYGKSTLVRLAAGVEPPDAGRITIGGHDLWHEEVAARRELAYVPELPELSPLATVHEILELVASLRHVDRAAIELELERVGLGQLGHRSVRQLSMGQKRRAVLAAARLGHPPHLFLDEPLESLDRQGRSDLLDWVRDRVDAGALVLVVSHDLEPFVDLADHAFSIVDGHATPVHRLATAPERRELLENLARGRAIG